jgi:hypothetical protein
MNLTDILSLLMNLVTGVIPKGLLAVPFGHLIDELESVISSNNIEHILLEPVIKLIRSEFNLPANAVTIPTNPNVPGVQIFPIPAQPLTGYYPGDMGNRAAFVTSQLVINSLLLSDVDVPTLTAILFINAGWQAKVNVYIASVVSSKKTAA